MDTQKESTTQESTPSYPPWISVKDRLPEEFESVIVNNGALVAEGYIDAMDKWYYYGVKFYPTNAVPVTGPILSWMPFPKPQRP